MREKESEKTHAALSTKMKVRYAKQQGQTTHHRVRLSQVNTGMSKTQKKTILNVVNVHGNYQYHLCKYHPK